MTASISLDKLTEELEKYIQVLMQKEFLPKLAGPEIKQLAKTVATTLANDKDVSLTESDLKKPEIGSALSIACIAEHQKDKLHKFDYRVLFKEQNNLDELALKNEFKNLLTAAMKKNPNYLKKTPDQTLQIEKQIDELSTVLSEKLLKNDSLLLAENKFALDCIAGCVDLQNDARSNAYRELYGVAKPGETFIPTVEIVGDLVGFTDLVTEGESFMAKRDEPNPNVPDPTGVKMFSIINFIADGITTEFEEDLQNEGIIPSPNRPAPKPPGFL